MSENVLGVVLGFVAGVVVAKNWSRICKWFSKVPIGESDSSGEAEA